MLKNRLIFTLLHGDGVYHLSRNFSLQKVGDIGWINKYYYFEMMSRYIDELMILDVSRGAKSTDALTGQLRVLGRGVFAPVAAGGGITSVADADRLFRAGADKVVLNTAFFQNPALPERLSRLYGAQSIVASLDYKIGADGARHIRIHNGAKDTKIELTEAVRWAESVGAGELYITCIDRDGTGEGYDLEGLRLCAKATGLPIIASGGAGNSAHFAQAMNVEGLQAVATANLFNFMDAGLQDARAELLDMGYALGAWAYNGSAS